MAEKKSVKTKKQTVKSNQPRTPKKANTSKAKDEFDQLKDRHIRLKAEFENFRKRKNREISSLLQYDGEGIIKEFTGISDPYEEPTNAEIIVDSSSESPEILVDQIYNYLIC